MCEPLDAEHPTESPGDVRHRDFSRRMTAYGSAELIVRRSSGLVKIRPSRPSRARAIRQPLRARSAWAVLGPMR